MVHQDLARKIQEKKKKFEKLMPFPLNGYNPFLQEKYIQNKEIVDYFVTIFCRIIEKEKNIEFYK